MTAGIAEQSSISETKIRSLDYLVGKPDDMVAVKPSGG
jgi:hypothetical protein